MCEQPQSWLAPFCWLANDWDFAARALLLLAAAAALALVVGACARLLPFFQMDEDDIRRQPRAPQLTRAGGEHQTLTPDEPDA